MDVTSWPILIGIAILTFLGMEAFAWWAHKYIMHGWGWGWHRSHHEPHDELLEKNDLYALVFAGFAIALFAIGAFGYPVISALAAGITLYGLFYFIVHDGLVHQRWPFRAIPHKGYAKRLVQAHRLHHAVKGREDSVSFGFLYAPPVDRLHAQLKASGVVERERRVEKGVLRQDAPTDPSAAPDGSARAG